MRAVILSISLILAIPAGAVADPEANAAKSYRVDTQGTTLAVPAGGSGTLVLSIVPLDGTKVHPQAPLKIALTGTPGLKLTRDTLGRKDAADPKAEGPRFEVPFTAVAAGAQEARAKVEFYLCADDWCARQTRDVAVAIAVK
ncbi:MAG TPA: hypothetical protein VEB43_09515 [Anaeromyxobacter sp.]|nr:hypothetical protein [Anaeromyxobacter sp.]